MGGDGHQGIRGSLYRKRSKQTVQYLSFEENRQYVGKKQGTSYSRKEPRVESLKFSHLIIPHFLDTMEIDSFFHKKLLLISRSREDERLRPSIEFAYNDDGVVLCNRELIALR